MDDPPELNWTVIKQSNEPANAHFPFSNFLLQAQYLPAQRLSYRQYIWRQQKMTTPSCVIALACPGYEVLPGFDRIKVFVARCAHLRWNREGERGAEPDGGVYFDATSVSLDNTFAGGQSETHPSMRIDAASLAKWFEDSLQVARLDADAVVTH